MSKNGRVIIIIFFNYFEKKLINQEGVIMVLINKNTRGNFQCDSEIANVLQYDAFPKKIMIHCH